MNAGSLRVLEYEEVRRRVVAVTACSLGAERAAAMAPATDHDAVQARLDETREALALLAEPGAGLFGGIADVRPALRHAAAGGVVDGADLLSIADTAAGIRRLKAAVLQAEERRPLMAALARELAEHPRLEQLILDSVAPDGALLDEASPLLARLRREGRSLRERMQERVQAILRSGGFREALQDSIITTRSGRYCVPVKAEFRAQFPGLVHDQSASGATLFIEPAPLVEMGNELRQLELREQHECDRILRVLSEQVGALAPSLLRSSEISAELDFILARARYAQSVDGAPPGVGGQAGVVLRRARHPLLESPVPIDLDLPAGCRVLILTGPNTGGKTVALKTLGLLALMAQSGLFPPADPGARLPLFRGIFADIGDEQSLHQSLSTFSGHLTNIVRILDQARESGPPCLILLDELGAGTDPHEGAALARAILTHLLPTGHTVAATSHFGELKSLSCVHEAVTNASVEFDEHSLKPTFRLLMGVPGASHALTIAERLGLSPEIVAEARAARPAAEAEAGDLIRRLTAELRRAEEEAARAARMAREAQVERDRLTRRLMETEEADRERAARTRARVQQNLHGFLTQLDAMRESLRREDGSASPSNGRPGEERRRRIREAEFAAIERAQELLAEASPEPQQVEMAPVSPGDPVRIEGVDTPGTLLALLPGDRAEVRVGAAHVTVPRNRLRPGPPPPAAPRRDPALAELLGQAARDTPECLELRGLRVEDALRRLDDYLDRACLSGLSPVRLLHGKGTGALRRAVWERLREHPAVASFGHPAEELGGSGVTVLDLRE